MKVHAGRLEEVCLGHVNVDLILQAEFFANLTAIRIHEVLLQYAVYRRGKRLIQAGAAPVFSSRRAHGRDRLLLDAN